MIILLKHNHSEPDRGNIQTVPHSGGMRILRKGFTWDKQRKKALKHQYQRSIDLARTNDDYKIKYPNECRENPECKVLKECHPEAQKRLLQEHEKILRLAVVPDVDRPVRLNRLG